MKKWNKPELIILARSRPEEVILSFCKTNVGPGASTTDQNSCSDNLVNPCNFVCLDLGMS